MSVVVYPYRYARAPQSDLAARTLYERSLEIALDFLDEHPICQSDWSGDSDKAAWCIQLVPWDVDSVEWISERRMYNLLWEYTRGSVYWRDVLDRLRELTEYPRQKG